MLRLKTLGFLILLMISLCTSVQVHGKNVRSVSQVDDSDMWAKNQLDELRRQCKVSNEKFSAQYHAFYHQYFKRIEPMTSEQFRTMTLKETSNESSVFLDLGRYVWPMILPNNFPKDLVFAATCGTEGLDLQNELFTKTKLNREHARELLQSWKSCLGEAITEVEPVKTFIFCFEYQLK